MLPTPPAADLRQIVGAHQPDETGARKAPLQRVQRVGGIAGAEPRLDIGHLDALVGHHRGGGRHPIGERRHAADRFQRVLRRDQPPDLVEPEPSQRLAADVQMAVMGGVERAAEQPDAAPPPVAERGGEREETASLCRFPPWRFAQGRTWPSPRTTYL